LVAYPDFHAAHLRYSQPDSDLYSYPVCLANPNPDVDSHPYQDAREFADALLYDAADQHSDLDSAPAYPDPSAEQHPDADHNQHTGPTLPLPIVAMRRLNRLLWIVSFSLILLGCMMPAAMSLPMAVSQRQPSLQATYVLAPPDSTPTPTPFQPLEPTSIYMPTSMPQTPEPTPQPTPTITVPAEFPEAQALEQLPSQINVLLLGSDKRPYGGGFRTDTIILVTLNKDLGRVNITSFPRDLWVTIPGWGTDRINTAWTHGGYNMLAATFKHNFGVTIDHYALIQFSDFKTIIDSLGGLNVQVAQPVSDYRAGYWVTIPAGEVHMDADTVLWYVRTRKTTNDIARNRRQQEVLQAIFEKLLSLNAIKRAPEFYSVYRQGVKTDVGLVDVLAWLPLVAKIAETRDIHQYALTYNHVYDWITPGGAMVLVPNPDAVMRVIRKSQNIP
jgi:LCP family protein required for cell wall assembly